MRVRSGIALIALVASAAAASETSPSADWLLDQVRTLSSAPMDGRRSGSLGADLAARHIAREFESAGLKPGGDAGTYFQRFDVPTAIKLGAPNRLEVLGPGARSMALGTDFAPLATSDSGTVTGAVVFAGYGITAPDLGYDDYAGLDARDKVVLVLAGEPRGRDPASPFRKPDAYHYSERRHKLINAREHGARAVLLVRHPAAPGERLPELRGVTQPSGVLAMAITHPAAEAILAPTGRTLRDLADAIDGSLRPSSLPLPGVQIGLEVQLAREKGPTANVVGLLPGIDPKLGGEAVVVGAHYDHLGHGGEGSLAPDQAGTVHPGADDNASGTAAVMALARSLASAGGLPRTVVFAAFTGEEMGLLGSTEYVRRPPVPLDRTVLMLNLDMVGRLREGKLHIGGVDSAHELRGVVERAAQAAGVAPELRGDPYAPSDHTAFYTADRPVLFFFTGAHADYHRPTDTWDKIDAAGLAKVTDLAMRVVTSVASAASTPVFVRVAAPPSSGRGGGSGYGPYFGVVPEFGDSAAPGVRITGVRAGSPAAKAGLRGGDVLVELGGVTLRTLEDLTFALRARRPGDEVDVRFVRDGTPRAGRAVLEERR